jgi:hypothetical protein
MKRSLCVASLVAVITHARAAHATHPDYEGELGLELTLSPGLGAIAPGDESVFLRPADLPTGGRAPLNAFSTGFDMSAQAGWRFTTYLSAGLQGGFTLPSQAYEYTSSEASFGPVDAIRSFHVGAYARLYPMSFFNGSKYNPRVFFDTLTDRRRFEPWLSLGVSYVQVSRSRTYEEVGFIGSNASWTSRYVGVPVGIGFEYRVIPALAVGLQTTLTPLLGGGTSFERTFVERRPGVSTDTMTQGSYAPASDSALAYAFGLSVRYTFTR